MEKDSLLVRHILSGDEEAWHRFVETNTPFLEKVIYRYIQDDELSRNLFVDLLEKLKNDKLRRFGGKASLQTWLFIVAKNHCRDYFRSRSGVRHILTALESLEPIDRRFFRLRYLERMPLREVYSSLRLEFGEGLSYIDLLECDEHVRNRLDEMRMGNIPDKLLNPQTMSTVHIGDARSSSGSGRGEHPSPSPELILDSMTLESALVNLRHVILQLPSKDQILLKLRFEHKLSARRISEVLDLSNEKQVYRRLKRLFSDLGKMLRDSELRPETYTELAANIEVLSRFRDGAVDIDRIR